MALCCQVMSLYLSQCWLRSPNGITRPQWVDKLQNYDEVTWNQNNNINDDYDILAHWGRLTHIRIRKLTNIDSGNGLSPERRQAIIWTNIWNIVNWTLENKFQWYFSRNQYIFIQENALENVVWKMAAIFLCLNVLNWWSSSSSWCC